MDKLVIQGGSPLIGKFNPSGSKNSALPIIFASIITNKKIKIKNTPDLNDIFTALRVLNSMGSEYVVHRDGISFDNSKINNFVASYDLVKTMRASILALGPLIAKYGKAKISLPGGCAIGARPVDLHIQAFKKLGAKIEVRNGYIYAEAKELIGADITFEQVSVTATENILIASTLAKGRTTIYNAAQEPEVSDLANFLNYLGAKISGIGTSTLTIEGVKELGGGEYFVCYDRIEIGTYLVAAAITNGNITIKNFNYASSAAVVEKLIESGCKIKITDKEINLDARGIELKAIDIKTASFPNFPTDMQAQFSVLNSVAKGDSIITETIFENRFMHIPELRRMGANFKISGNNVICSGVEQLTGANLMATDLRASASLVLAGLAAVGTTTIERIYHLDRGYAAIEEKMRKLGANIKRITE